MRGARWVNELAWLTLAAMIALVVLILLGNWQMRRMEYKSDLIALVNERVAGAPISFKALKARALDGGDIRYQPVQVKGRFDHTQERHYFLPLKSQVGWHIITPLKTEGGDVVLIDRGFVPDEFKSQKRRLNGLPSEVVTISGLARQTGQRNFFTPENDLKRNRWFWRDLEGLYKSLKGVPPKPLPFMIDAGSKTKAGVWPMSDVTKVSFSDPHFGYALTWYGLALTLIFVYLAFVLHRVMRARSA